jgi:S1-C subfamily serine protease
MTLSRRSLLAGITSVGLVSLPSVGAAAEASPGADVTGAGLLGRGFGASVEILWVDPLGPAARSGLREGDRVVGWADGELPQLGRALNGAPDSRLVLTVIRGASQRQVQLVLEGEGQIVRP